MREGLHWECGGVRIDSEGMKGDPYSFGINARGACIRLRGVLVQILTFDCKGGFAFVWNECEGGLHW